MENIVATWRTPGIFKADAQKVCNELREIGEEFTPEEIVEAAKDNTKELHKCFEWDDQKAANSYRIQQARILTSQIIFKVDTVEEELFFKMLSENAPCITSFGLKKSWGQAVVRQEIDKYSTKFDSAVNIVTNGGLIPIKFAEWRLDERLMSPKRGAPITTRLNHFVGWTAEIPVEFTTNVYSNTEIATIINYAGFSLGIGSGRSSGYGRYHIKDIR